MFIGSRNTTPASAGGAAARMEASLRHAHGEALPNKIKAAVPATKGATNSTTIRAHEIGTTIFVIFVWRELWPALRHMAPRRRSSSAILSRTSSVSDWLSSIDLRSLSYHCISSSQDFAVNEIRQAVKSAAAVTAKETSKNNTTTKRSQSIEPRSAWENSIPSTDIFAGMSPVVAIAIPAKLATSKDFRTDRVCCDNGSDTRITSASNGFNVCSPLPNAVFSRGPDARSAAGTSAGTHSWVSFVQVRKIVS